MYFQQLNFNIGYNCVYVDCQTTSEYGLRLFSCWRLRFDFDVIEI